MSLTKRSRLADTIVRSPILPLILKINGSNPNISRISSNSGRKTFSNVQPQTEAQKYWADYNLVKV